MELRLEDYESGWGSELNCPECGGNYMHQGAVEIFDRNEDAATGIHVKVDDELVTVDRNLAGNPSSRRHGLTIAIQCECSAKFSLIIKQHKGQTYLDLIQVAKSEH